MVTPAELVDAAVKAGLDLIAVTDHDTMAAARDVKERGESAGLAVVMGQETTTAWPAQTHILGWFLEKPIARSMSVEDTVKAIRDQGGLVIIPHPFMPTYFASIQPDMLRRLIAKQPVDGIERLGALIGSSDCHFGSHDIAQVVTAYEGDFRAAIVERKTTPRRGPGKLSVPTGMFWRQQWRALVDLPVRRLRGQI
jgi:hypothetical protein